MLVVKAVDARRRELWIGSPKRRKFCWEEVRLGKKKFWVFPEGFLSDFQLFFSGFFSRLSVDYRAEKEEYSVFKRNCYFMIFLGEGK